ncbi:unnamed protein product [Orchesella dallaii]|uniref:Uncharacterized protein n=1 Tax=Orchesella dallaii TaxID=48710 RepID=A0ABP1RGH3_9HEXA
MKPIPISVLVCILAKFSIASIEIELEPTPLPFQRGLKKYTGLSQREQSCITAKCTDITTLLESAVKSARDYYEDVSSLSKYIEFQCELDALISVTSIVTACYDGRTLRSAASEFEATIAATSATMLYMEQIQTTGPQEIQLEPTPLPFQHGLSKYTELSQPKVSLCITGNCAFVDFLLGQAVDSAYEVYESATSESNNIVGLCSYYSSASITSSAVACFGSSEERSAASTIEATKAATSAAMTYMEQRQTAFPEASF